MQIVPGQKRCTRRGVLCVQPRQKLGKRNKKHIAYQARFFRQQAAQARGGAARRTKHQHAPARTGFQTGGISGKPCFQCPKRRVKNPHKCYAIK